MHGKRGAELLDELRKSASVPPYNENGVRLVAAEIKELLEPLLEIVQNHRDELSTDQSYGAGVLVYHRSIQRNKRCALAYLMNRLRRIQAYRWEAGNVAAAHLAENMSAPETHFLAQYNKLLGKYCDQVELDLTAEAQPPKDLYIEVRVVRDCGAVVTDSGPVTLKPGTAHFLKRTDVEHLIRQGALQHIV
jgi:GINS complex subunit 1